MVEQLQRFFLRKIKLFPTLELRLFGLARIPLLFATSPKVIELNDERIKVAIPLNRITRNHLGSMYFGTLAIGADCAGGVLANHHIQKSGKKIGLVFKDFHADFLKRPTGEVVFCSEDGGMLAALVDKVISTGERHHETIQVEGFCESEKVANFQLTISLKMKTK